MLAFISLTTPILLAGLSLLSLPLIAHWLQRHSRHRLVFPTVAFLLAAAAAQSRFHRLKRWTLLLLRLLAVACIVLAFTRPIWLDVADTDAATEDDAVGVVVLVDLSASAAQRSDGVDFAQQLRSAGTQALDDLRAGTDVANVIALDAAPEAVFPRMSPNIVMLRQEVERMTPTEERADAVAGITLAGRLLGEHRGPRRLVVLSDLQRTNWREELTQIRAGEVLPADTQVTVVEPSAGVGENVSLSEPHFFPPRPLPRQACDLTVRVTNYSERTRQVRVTMEWTTGEAAPSVADQTVNLLPGDGEDVTFAAAAPDDGPMEVTFSIPPDDLDLDNRAFLVVESSDRLPVVIVSDDDPDEAGTAAFYIERALSPRGDSDDRFDVRRLRSFELSTAALSGAQAALVGYCADLSPEAVSALSQYVRNGGGVVFFCGEGPVARNLEALQEADPELLPWVPTHRQQVADRADPLHIAAGRWQSRWFREFDEQSQIAISQIGFERFWSVAAAAPEADVLLSFSNGQPALGSRLCGQGQFLLANFSPEVTSSDLGKHGAFVAWTQILAKSLMPEAVLASSAHPGVTVQWPRLLAEDEVRGSADVLGPDGTMVVSTTTAYPDGVRVAIPEPRQTGLYRVTAGGRTLGALVLNLDPRESDLRRLPVEDFVGALRGQGISTQSRSVAGFSPVLNIEGRPLWGTFFLAALCAIGLELFLLGLWKH